MTTAWRARRIRPRLAETHILERRELTPDHWLMWIEKPEGFTFKPGQYCTIGSEGIERAYSIASAPHEGRIELFIELVPYEEGGHLTPLLYEMKPGDSFFVACADPEERKKLANRMNNSASNFARSMPLGDPKFTVRQVEEDGKAGVRAWRLK